jgi:hypothetical protein
LARKLAHDLGQKHLKDPTQPVPVLVNLRELNRAVMGKAKVLLTSRTHYFRDSEEEKRLIGTDKSLTLRRLFTHWQVLRNLAALFLKKALYNMLIYDINIMLFIKYELL